MKITCFVERPNMFPSPWQLAPHARQGHPRRLFCHCHPKMPLKSFAIQNISLNLYKEYTSLKSRELEELPRFRVMSWQPS